MLIPDIEIIDEEDHQGRAKYCVSDGVGRVSLDLAARIMADLGLDPNMPLTIQVRGRNGCGADRQQLFYQECKKALLYKLFCEAVGCLAIARGLFSDPVVPLQNA